MPHPAAAKRVLVIVNPTAGRRKLSRVAAVCRQLEHHGVDVTRQDTEKAGDAETLAREAVARGTIDVLMVAGGDGTINEVINGLGGSPLPLGIIACGTANVLALEMALPTDADAIVRAVLVGKTRTLHVGSINGRFFALMVGVGFDADVVARTSGLLKKWLGKAAYGVAVLSAIFRQQAPHHLRIDGRDMTARSAIVSNARLYGGRFVLCADANLERPELYVCLFRGAGVWKSIGYVLALALGRLHALGDVDITPAQRIDITAPAPALTQVDGDKGPNLPVSIEADAARVFVIVDA